MKTSNVWWKYGFGSRLAYGIGIYLILVLQPFLALWLAFKKQPATLVYPYLACIVPGIVFQLLISILRLREVEGTSPKRHLAISWGMGGALFAVGTVIACVFSAVSLGFMDRPNIVGATIVSLVLSGSIFYVVLHYMVLDRISARGRREITLDGPNQSSPK